MKRYPFLLLHLRPLAAHSAQQNRPPVGIEIPQLVIATDKDGDGINDLDDILQGARKDAVNRPAYRSAYYAGGYPPDDEGVCSDVVWRAFKNAGYDLKAMIDVDIRRHIDDYPRVGGCLKTFPILQTCC